MGVGANRDGYELTQHDPRYPKKLLDLPNPPERLYVRGSIEILEFPSLSIVGTRDPTPYGKAATELAARIGVEAGLTIVSGGAIGCDGIAGRETLARGGRHVIIPGCGADVVYPRRNADLFQKTLESGGLILSLEPWGMQPRKYLFPKRNAIIAALSEAIYIAEARVPSGTFTTAEVALQVGREILVVPGSIFSPTSAGTNYLISEGAVCIANEDALETAFARIYQTLRHEQGFETITPGTNEEEQCLLRAITASPLSINEISQALSLNNTRTIQLLGDLTLRGLVELTRDGRYSASSTAFLMQTSFGHNGMA